MSEKIVLEDGTEREVLTDEEVQNLKAGHDANQQKKPIVEQYKKIREELGIGEDGDIEEKLSQMKEEANPNFKAMRDKQDKLEKENKELKEKYGHKEEGTPEDLDKKFEEKFQARDRENALSKFTSEERKSLEPLVERLMVMGGTLEENISLASGKLFPDNNPDPLKGIINNAGGGAPRMTKISDMSSDVKGVAAKLGITEDELNKSK
jgi:hypothetical protein